MDLNRLCRAREGAESRQAKAVEFHEVANPRRRCLGQNPFLKTRSQTHADDSSKQCAIARSGSFHPRHSRRCGSRNDPINASSLEEAEDALAIRQDMIHQI
jgi:hypothetical protein